jgi:phosphoribosylformimino-5-aminoimidazole carboxamide ribotide isomerase
MIILPAIDIRGGRCVRLRQGDYAQETIFNENPVAVAEEFQKAGAQWLHVVDLDGAREGEPRNLDTIRSIVEAVGKTVAIEVGGGIRTTEMVGKILGFGADRVVVGSRAKKDPQWLIAIANMYSGRIAFGIDARQSTLYESPQNRRTSTASALTASSYVGGWKMSSGHTAGDDLRAAKGLPLAAIIYTDIVRDGMMSGPNVEATAAVVKAAAPIPVIASGGVTTVEDIRRLKDAGAVGAIIGRALYEGKLTLKAALAAAREP